MDPLQALKDLYRDHIGGVPPDRAEDLYRALDDELRELIEEYRDPWYPDVTPDLYRAVTQRNNDQSTEDQ